MTMDLVLISGISGHVGFRVLVEALRAGYHVRGIVRQSSHGDKIKKAQSVRPYVGNLDLVVVKDMLVDGAFDEAMKDVTYVIHLASPLSRESEDYERDLIGPAVKITTGILKPAAKCRSVKRVVITSSIAVLIPPTYLGSKDTERVFTADVLARPPNPKSKFPIPMAAYAASKSLALDATYRFLRTEKPTFDVVAFMPSMIIGKNELVTEKDDITTGTNGITMGIVLGNKELSPMLGASVHVDDVARVHVQALQPSVRGNQNFICSSGGLEGTKWDDTIGIVRSTFAARVADGTLPLGGTQPTRPIKFDASNTEKTFGFKFQSYEAQVKSVVGHYLGLTSHVSKL